MKNVVLGIVLSGLLAASRLFAAAPLNDGFAAAAFTPLGPATSTLSAGSMVAGNVYRIASVGDTNFVGVGAPVNLKGAVFVAKAAAAGSGLVNAVASYTGTNVDATKEVGEPTLSESAAGKTVWWNVTVSTRGLVTVDTSGSTFDTIVSVYTGTSVSSLTEVAHSDDVSTVSTASQATFYAYPGRSYYIAVDGFSGGPSAPQGTVKLNLVHAADGTFTPNDNFADRTLLTGELSVANGDSIDATLEIGESNSSFISWGSKSVWWSWIAPQSGLVTVTSQMDINAEFFGDYLEAVLEVYAPSPSSDDGRVGIDWDVSSGFSPSETAALSFNAVAGQEYYFRASSWAATLGAQITLTVELAEPEVAANDRFVKGSAIQGSSAVILANNTSATVDQGEPAHYIEVSSADLVVGNQYMIVDSGTSDFTSAGALANTPGTMFYATGSVVGTGKALLLRPMLVSDDIVVRAGQFEVGKRYVIVSLGSTDFTEVGATANTVGRLFTATGQGQGTGTARLFDAGLLKIGQYYWINSLGDTDFIDVGAPNEDIGTTFQATDVGSGSGTVLPVEIISAGSFVSGRIYKIESVGTTDFTLIGAASNTVGLFFKATGEGTGTGTASTLTASRSLWWTWVAPENGYLSLDTTDSDADTVINVYTGNRFANLSRKAGNDDAGTDDSSSFVNLPVEKGVTYRIAVGAAAANRLGGSIQLVLQFTPDFPVLVGAVPDVKVFVGETAQFVVRNTGAAAVYAWQRKAVGSTSWVFYSAGVTTPASLTNGVATSTASVPNVTAAMNGDQFRCVISNMRGQVVTKPATLTIVSINTFTGSVQDVELSDELPVPPVGASVRYFAKGVPKGLTLDPLTGRLYGRLAVRSGTYVVTYWAVVTHNGVKTKTATKTLVISTLPFPAELVGDFEGLLMSNTAVPIGKVTMKVNADGLFTGRLSYVGFERPLKGALSLDDVETPTSGSVTLNPTPDLTVVLNIARSDSLLTGTVSGALTASITDGAKLKSYTTLDPALWSGLYTISLADPSEGPEGAGYYSASFDTKGKMSMRGRLADGTAVTASLLPDSSTLPVYRLYTHLYSKRQGYVAGAIPLSRYPGVNGKFHATSDLYWYKVANVRDRSYRDGFLATVSLQMERWMLPQQSYLIGSLGLLTTDPSNIGKFSVLMDLEAPNGLSNAGANLDGYPVELEMDAVSRVLVLSSAPAVGNPRGWSIKIAPSTGVFSGSFVLPDRRKASITGVLLQLPSGTTENRFGRGYFLVPPVAGDPTSTIRSGALDLVGPAIP